MRKAFYFLAALLSLSALVGVASFGLTHIAGAKASGGTCTPTGFYRDGINLTAAVIATSTTISGPISPTGCNIGIYYGPGISGAVTNATIAGYNYFGVVT